WHFSFCEFASLSKTDDASHVQRSTSHAAFVTAAVHHWNQNHAWILPSDVQPSNALRTVDLVSRERSQIDIQFADVEWNLTDRLRRVGVEKHALFFGNFPDFGYRLDNADFIVRHHYSYKDCLIGDCVFDVVGSDHSVTANRKIRYFESSLLELLAAIQDGFVFSDRGNNVVAALVVHIGDTFDREVVGFSRAAGENDLF